MGDEMDNAYKRIREAVLVPGPTNAALLAILVLLQHELAKEGHEFIHGR